MAPKTAKQFSLKPLSSDVGADGEGFGEGTKSVAQQHPQKEHLDLVGAGVQKLTFEKKIHRYGCDNAYDEVIDQVTGEEVPIGQEIQ